jgi:DNA-binding MarR family transcriptional regulator
MLADVARQRSRLADGSSDPMEALYDLVVTVVRRVPRDLSLTQLATMSTLARTGPRRVTDLAAIQGVTQPSMTELIANLERLGHVRRRPDPRDGRASLAALTAAGRDYLLAQHQAGTEALAGLADRLPGPERAALAAAVPALVHLCELDSQEREPRPATGAPALAPPVPRLALPAQVPHRGYSCPSSIPGPAGTSCTGALAIP